MAKAPAKNPLTPAKGITSAVAPGVTANSYVTSASAPFGSQIGTDNNQFKGDLAYSNKAEGALQSTLKGIGNDQNAVNTGMLGQAAAAYGQDQAQQAANNHFLRGVFGNWGVNINPGLAASSGLLNSQQLNGSTALATQLGLDRANMGRDVGFMRSSGALANREWQNNQGTAHSNAVRALHAQIAAINAQKPYIKRQMQQEAFDNWLKQQSLGVSQQNANSASASSLAGLQNADAKNPNSTKSGQYAGYGISQKYDQIIQNYHAHWLGQSKWKDNSFTDALSAVAGFGVNKFNAAKMVADWSPGTFQGKDPRVSYDMLHNQGLDKNQALFIIHKFFPKFQYKAATNTSGAVGGIAGQVIGNVAGGI